MCRILVKIDHNVLFSYLNSIFFIKKHIKKPADRCFFINII